MTWERRALACLALAAAVVPFVVPSDWRLRFADSPGRPELQELFAAVAKEGARAHEARLAGGAPYAPLRPETRGATERHASSDVLIAAAKIQNAAEADDSPPNRAALGVAYLVAGDEDRAVEALEEAVQGEPRDGRFRSDLAAALLSRAKSQGHAEDWVAALDAAEHAIRIDPSQVEARFNRALALEGLHLIDQAIDARLEYHRIETSTPWLHESNQRLQQMREAVARAEQKRGANDNQLVRERIEDVLLPAWAQHTLASQTDLADAALDEATRLATQLADLGGDTMALDGAQIIARAQEERNDGALRDLARGHALFGEARQDYVRDNQGSAADLMARAATHFARARSPYASWAPVYRSIYSRNQGEAQRSLDEALQVDVRSMPATYLHLRGRVAWASGVALGEIGRYDLSLERIRNAAVLYEEASEVDNLTAVRTGAANLEWLLGNTAGAWTHLLSVLEDVADNGGSRRDAHLGIGGLMAHERGLVNTAVAFDNARVNVAGSPRTQTEAFLTRAKTHALANDLPRAMEDLARAEHAIAGLTDPALRERNLADIQIARASALSETDCRLALASANAAMEYVPKADPNFRLADLLAVRAKCRRALGDVDGARADLLHAIDAFEERRSKFASLYDRTQAFERERHVFKRLIAIEADTAGGPDRALAIAERARAGALLERWTAPGVAPTAIDLTVVRGELAAGTAIVYYELLPEKTLVWTITREQVSFFTSPLSAGFVEHAVTRINRRIRDGASLTTLAPYSRELFDTLIRPALERADDPSVVFFVPDGALYGLSFGALPDDQGRPLLATRRIGLTPGLGAFVAASRRLADFSPDEVLAVGDGHDPVATGLPLLRWADIEAARVGDLYPHRTALTKATATKARVTRSDPDVIHFAGHTVANRRFPALSRLLLAPGRRTSESGAWFASEILEHRFQQTRVAVLSTCDSAVGKFVPGEGNLSVARAFFAAGVPSVVASLWPVDDDVVDVMVAFHRELRARRDPVEALRAVQRSLYESDRDAPIRRWGGFIAFGGSAPIHSSHSTQNLR